MKRHFDSPDEVRHALARRLGHEPSEVIWQQLQNDGQVEDVLSDAGAGYSLDDLYARYRELQSVAHRYADEKAGAAADRFRRRRQVPPDRAQEVEARIGAIEAADHPDGTRVPGAHPGRQAPGLGGGLRLAQRAVRPATQVDLHPVAALVSPPHISA